MKFASSKRIDRIRVLLTVPQLATGGSERAAFSLLKHLDRQIFDVALLSLYPYSGLPYEREAAKSGLKVHYLSKSLGFDWRIFFEVDRFFRHWHPQVVQNHLHHLYLVVPACIRNRTPVRLHRFSTVIERELANPARRLVYAKSFRHLGVHPVAISQQVRFSGKPFFGNMDMPVIFSGVDLDFFKPAPEPHIKKWRAENHIHFNATAFVNVARFYPPKNHSLLIKAFAGVARSFPSAILILAGDGPLLSATRQLVNQLGLQEQVRFLGIREDVAELLNASDIFVLSSDWEGVPISGLEAMATGKPIISTAVGGVPEIVEHKGNGFLITPGNIEELAQAMLLFCRSHKLIQHMGHRSRQIAIERHDVRKMAQNYGKLYIRLLKEKCPSGRRA
jgi:glycosyltransferase involved in cell wall biosynthesis